MRYLQGFPAGLADKPREKLTYWVIGSSVLHTGCVVSSTRQWLSVVYAQLETSPHTSARINKRSAQTNIGLVKPITGNR